MATHATELARMFDGKVGRIEYVQHVAALKWRNETLVDGVPVSWSEGINVFTAKVTEETFRFTGLSYAAAHDTGSVNVTDVGRISYTVPLDPALTQLTYDDLSWEKYSVTIQRNRISPHLWELVVTVKNAVLYLNGSVAPNQG